MDVMNKTIIRLFLFYGRTNEEKDQAYSSVFCCLRFTWRDLCRRIFRVGSKERDREAGRCRKIFQDA